MNQALRQADYRWTNLWWRIRKFAFVVLLRVADECDGCGRIIPSEWKWIAAHWHFFGRRHEPFFLCTRCSNRESILDQFFYDPTWDDEYDDPYDLDVHPIQCEVCGGEIAGSYSTCICEDDGEL